MLTPSLVSMEDANIDSRSAFDEPITTGTLPAPWLMRKASLVPDIWRNLSHSWVYEMPYMVICSTSATNCKFSSVTTGGIITSGKCWRKLSVKAIACDTVGRCPPASCNFNRNSGSPEENIISNRLPEGENETDASG